MKNLIPLTALAALAASGLASAQTAYSKPSGYVTITCPPNSDTIVGVPLRQSAALAGVLSTNLTQSNGQATLTLGSSFSGSFAGNHYVKFSSGPDAGKILPVVSNTTTTLVVATNGDTLTSVQGNALEVVKFWTLGELFDPALATTDPTTTPNAVVASTNTLASGRRTQILLPNKEGVGINLSASAIFFVNSSQWKKAGTVGEFSDFQLWPDSYMIIRNPSAVTSATKYITTGQVEAAAIAVPLSTLASGQQDNFIALPRPVDVSLDSLNLKDTSAFVSSTSTLALGRKDQLLVFENAQALQNKSASAIYFVLNGQWRRAGSPDNAGTDVIKGGDGFIIRKAATGSGQTVFWLNNPSYSVN